MVRHKLQEKCCHLTKPKTKQGLRKRMLQMAWCFSTPTSGVTNATHLTKWHAWSTNICLFCSIIDSHPCASNQHASFAQHMLHLHASMLGFVLLLQCPTLKWNSNLTMRPLSVHPGVLKGANAAVIMTDGIVHQRAITDAYNACVERRRTSVTNLGQLSPVVAFAPMMVCHDAIAEMCHRRMLQATQKMLVGLSGPVFFSWLTQILH